jgi:hypothetical protein
VCLEVDIKLVNNWHWVREKQEVAMMSVKGIFLPIAFVNPPQP